MEKKKISLKHLCLRYIRKGITAEAVEMVEGYNLQYLQR